MQIDYVLVIVNTVRDLSYLGHLATVLPAGEYAIKNNTEVDYKQAAIFWAMGAYQFTKYKTSEAYLAKLILPECLSDSHSVANIIAGIYLTRDLINTPCEDMSPSNLALVAKALTDEFGGKFNEIVGDKLLKENFPAIHAVGRASSNLPRLIEINWGNEHDDHLVLVGKGVCFDTGGYDIKSASGMRLMKKDMGGAAHVLGLARIIMADKLPVKLTVLIPAVENAISSNAYKPGDVVQTRQGLTIEIGNTDAEGRVILSDALAYAAEKKPQLIIDFATLTGAAKVGLGSELPALFSNQADLAANLQAQSFISDDPMWQLPLHQPYRDLIQSPIADISNSASSPYGGAITAALFLESFVDNRPWIHCDLMAWNFKAKPMHGFEINILPSRFNLRNRRSYY